MTSHFAPRFRLRRAVLCIALALAFWPTTLWSAETSYEPRPISDAERAAVETVLAFLETGPNAVLTRLSADSPLRALDSTRALDEIAVRMGPAEGSSWQLRTPGRNFEKNLDVAVFTVEFASGIDDTILIHLSEEADGTWGIFQIRCTVDPRMPISSAQDELNRLFQDDAGAPVLPGTRAPMPGSRIRLTAPLVAGCLLAALVLASLLVGRCRRRDSVALLLAAALAVAGCQFLPGGDEEEVEEEPYMELDAQELAQLLPLRRALAGGRSSGQGDDLQEEIGDLVANLTGVMDPNDQLALGARAWQTQLLILDGAYGAATKLLDAAPQPDGLPLMALLRARLATLMASEDAVKNYDLARKLGPDHDGLAQEAAIAVASVGEDGKMEEHIRSQVWIQSRSAEPFYWAAQFDAMLDQMEKAERLFQAGWRREPLNRYELLQSPIVAHIAIRPALFPLLSFADAEEPRVGPEHSAKRPLTSPERAVSRIVGEHLQIQFDDRSLSILGGGDLAPEGTVVESAGERAEREISSAVARFDELSASLATGGALRPSHRRAMETLADSLVYRKSWKELIRFTEPLAQKPETAPPTMIQARALALMRTDQKVEAANLLIELAKSDRANRRRDAGTFYQLGEMLTELGQYELALRAMEKASSISAFDFTSQRRDQIGLMKELEESKKIFDSRHFRMVYPASTGERYPRQLSWVLEAEWDRVQKWIPVPAGAPKVEIHLFPFTKFMKAYARTGGLVGGLYDGVVRVPLADFESFHPELIRIVSHEVAHAMIDIATRDRAPKWFHEGLAGHIEMHQREINPMPDMHEAGRDLTFTLLEPVLAGWSEPQLVELAYTNAAWTLHFIESKRGVRGIHRILDAFRRGNDTEAAIRKVFGVSVEEFDRDFRAWAVNQAPTVWPSDMVAYHEKFSDLVRRDSMDPLDDPKDDAMALNSGNMRYREGRLEKEMKAWHAGYSTSVRPVKVALAKALPMLQGKADGDVQGACRELDTQLELLFDNRANLSAPEAQVATYLRQAYGSFKDMAEHCQSRKWKSMRTEMERAVYYLGKAKDEMHPFKIQP